MIHLDILDRGPGMIGSKTACGLPIITGRQDDNGSPPKFVLPRHTANKARYLTCVVCQEVKACGPAAAQPMKAGDLNASHLGREVVIQNISYSLSFISHSLTKTRIVATWADATTDWSGDREFPHDEPAHLLFAITEESK